MISMNCTVPKWLKITVDKQLFFTDKRFKNDIRRLDQSSFILKMALKMIVYEKLTLAPPSFK